MPLQYHGVKAMRTPVRPVQLVEDDLISLWAPILLPALQQLHNSTHLSGQCSW
jgi:hypothetical protein